MSITLNIHQSGLRNIPTSALINLEKFDYETLSNNKQPYRKRRIQNLILFIQCSYLCSMIKSLILIINKKTYKIELLITGQYTTVNQMFFSKTWLIYDEKTLGK